MLQETHSKSEDETIWTKEWGGEIVFSHGSSSSRGACIMFAPNMEYNINDKYLDPQGRFVILNVTINDVKLTLANIYGPNNDDDKFFLDIFENIELMGNDNRIIGGDFNCVLDNNLDKRGGKPTHAHKKNTGNVGNVYGGN